MSIEIDVRPDEELQDVPEERDPATHQKPNP
jgi:hypothetical protein